MRSRFPALKHLGLERTKLSFDYARGFYMHRQVSDGRWSYEPDVLALLLALLGRSPRSVFVDVGANIGYFPILIKKLLGERVWCLAFEPMPELKDAVKRGMLDNGIEFELSASAVSDFVGTAPFYLSSKTDSSNSMNERFRPHKSTISVPVTTIDAEFVAGRHLTGQGLSEAWPHDECDAVVLIDTESTEPDVIRGAFNFIGRARPAIICEVLAGRTEDALEEIVREIGYIPFSLRSDGITREDRIRGDPTYQHRDWLFLPDEHPGPPGETYLETLRLLTK